MRAILPLVVSVQTYLQDRVERLKEDRDRGASAIEYAGLILIAGVIIVALIGFAKGTIKTAITNAINQIFGGGGS